MYDVIKVRYAMMFLLLAIIYLSGIPLRAGERLERFEKDGKWGCKDEKGHVVIPPEFRIDGEVIRCEFSPEGVALMADKKGLIYVDRQGKRLFRPFIFDNWVDDFREGLARFVQNGKIGFYDRHYRIVIEARFDFVEPFHHGQARFCVGCKPVKLGEHYLMEGGKWGYIDRKGRVVVKPRNSRRSEERKR
ncbi:MAG: WG repeat-containing protein [Nitrospinota bacterium]|nr:MAG: WG repeat-containing protein [Nitrospinota bacterium]